MARPHRTDAEGAVHHVMVRGVDGRSILAGEADAEDLLARFGRLVGELGFTVLAWCLLSNHAHFVLQTGAVHLAQLMARLGSRHAQRFNRANHRAGHLFQDRYEAVPIDDEGGLARCIAYVLANPVRHGLLAMRDLAAFRYSGYGALVGRSLPRSFESPGAVASAIGVDREGLPAFVHAHAVAPSARSAALEPDQLAELDLLIRHCCRRHGIPESALRSAIPAAQPAREAVCSLAAGSLALPITEVARRVAIPYATAKRLYAEARTGTRANRV